MNVIPAVGESKKPLVSWKEDPRLNMQIEPIPEEMHNKWKKNKAFKDGMAIICGKVLHNPEKKHLYLCAVDADNMKAIEELTANGLIELSKKTLVEQHANPEKAHIYFYTTKPMQKKSSDALTDEMTSKMNANEIPAIELKGEGEHGIMYCTPSPHKDGSTYQILGTDTPAILDNIGEVVNDICNKFSLGKGSNNLVPMKLLMEDDTKILKGSNRHEAIMRYAERILRKYPSMEDRIFKDIIEAKNQRMCIPPLNSDEMDTQIECAIDFISKQIEAEKALREIARHKFATPEFWEDVTIFVKAFHPKGSFVRCLECKKQIDANPLEHEHYGHLVEIK